MARKDLQWDSDAEERLKKIPFFVRKFAKNKIENVARAEGKQRVTVALMEKIKQQEMGR